MATTSVNIDQKFDVQKAASVYQSIGKAHSIPSYSFSCSPTVIKTGKNYYDSLKILTEMIEQGELPPDSRFMTQTEGHAIERSYTQKGKDPRKADEFKDYFAKNKDKVHMWEWTSTGLRVPKGWKNGKIDTDTEKYPRIVLIGDKEVGELQVPTGNGRVIVESDDVFGIPIETREIAWPHEGYYAHWYFNPTPKLDKISGHYDVAVGRRSSWLRVEGERCLYVDADCGRSVAYSYNGFRPVRGSVPEIQVVSSNVDIEQVKRKIFGKARTEFSTDLRKLPSPELLEKYKL